MPKKEVTPMQVPEISIGSFDLTLVGTSPLIMHKWSEKAKKQMAAKQSKEPKQGREPRDPQRDYEDSIYHHPEGGYGFPTVGIKAAAVNAAVQADMFKTEARAAFHINGEMVKIDGKPSMRTDMVRIMGTSDLRYRAEFKKWKTTFTILYNTSLLKPEQIVNLFNLAGFGVGIGEWRPQKNGPYGRFEVA